MRASGSTFEREDSPFPMSASPAGVAAFRAQAFLTPGGFLLPAETLPLGSGLRGFLPLLLLDSRWRAGARPAAGQLLGGCPGESLSVYWARRSLCGVPFGVSRVDGGLASLPRLTGSVCVCPGCYTAFVQGLGLGE